MQAPSLDELRVDVADEEPVQVAEAPWRWMLRLTLGRADEKLGGAAGGTGRELDEAVVHVLPTRDADLQGVEGEAIAAAAPGAALQHVFGSDFVNGHGRPHATAVYEPNQYVAASGGRFWWL